MSRYTMLSKYGNCTRLLKIFKKATNRLFFTNKVGKNSRYFVGFCDKTIIPLALVGYEMIMAIYHLLSNANLIVNYTEDFIT